MATRLGNIKPTLSNVSTRLGSLPDPERTRFRVRDATQTWRRWYKTARWQKLRWKILVRDLFTCRMCGRVESDTSRLVADHKNPHRGDEALFWESDNLQCLCKPCHDSRKQSEERRSRR